MPPINGLSRIVQILQTKVSDRKKLPIKTDEPPSSTNFNINQNDSANFQKASLAELEKRVIERLKSISVDNVSSNNMVRYFVESILTWEFGDEILQDPTFSDLSQEVVESFKSNQQAWEKIEIILNELRHK